MYMTNGNRVKRGLASDSRCGGCNGSLEDAVHVLRDCPHAMAFWQVLLLGNKWNEFFSGECREWLTKNVMRREIEGIPLQWNVLSQHRNINIDVHGNMTYCLVLYFEIDQLKEI